MAVLAYLLHDWRHISLNISMRDPQAVRADCEKLLVLYKSTYPREDYTMYISGPQLPPSFVRLKAEWALVTRGAVQIRLNSEKEINWWGGGWGYLYNPKPILGAYGKPSRLSIFRPTWYRDFYEFIEPGEM